LPYALFEHLAHRANEPIIEVCSVVAFQVPFICGTICKKVYQECGILCFRWSSLPTGRGIL
jgi:hypothetical protein